MNITYTGYLKRDSWENGIEFCEDITEWALQYESQHMVPAAANKQTANELFALLLYYVPKPCLPFAQQCIGALMGERLSTAMIHPTPSPTAVAIVNGSLALRRFVLRYLAFPRFTPRLEFSEKDPKSGRYHHLNYLVHPYYVKPTISSRWGVQAWLTWAFGGVVPGGAGGEKYIPEGYFFAEVGPDKKKTFSQEDLRVWEREVEGSISLGCPFPI